jgi:DHA3 family macrolide efflux protein-like MFS transporter
MIVAPMASGALLTFVPLEFIFFIDVVTAAIAIFLLYFFVKETETPAAPLAEDVGKGANYFRDLIAGVRYIYHEPFIWKLLLISVVFHIAVTPSAFLTPLQVTRNFGDAVWRLTAIEVAFSGGLMIGGVVVGFWGGLKNKIYSMGLAYLLCGFGTIALGMLGNFWLYLVVMWLTGLFVPLYETPAMTIYQTKVDTAYIGRVFGVMGMVSSLIMPLAMVVFGPLGDIISIDSILVGCGVLMLLLAVPFMVDKTLKEVGR